MAKKHPAEDGRIVLSDNLIPQTISGTIGLFFEWSNPKSGAKILFIYVYSGDDGKLAWGEILVWDRKDIELITSIPLGLLLVTLAITQADAGKSAARPGGLRPAGRIILSQIIATAETGESSK